MKTLVGVLVSIIVIFNFQNVYAERSKPKTILEYSKRQGAFVGFGSGEVPSNVEECGYIYCSDDVKPRLSQGRQPSKDNQGLSWRYKPIKKAKKEKQSSKSKSEKKAEKKRKKEIKRKNKQAKKAAKRANKRKK